MITEDFVSFETAKLLKEKGFDYPTLHYYYDKDGDLVFSWNIGAGKNEFVAPTLQMAMKWLRETHKLCTVVKPYVTEEGIFYLFEIKKLNKDLIINERTKTGFDTYEESSEGAIKYCLENLI